MFHGPAAVNAAAFGFKQGPCVDHYRCVSKRARVTTCYQLHTIFSSALAQ